METSHVICVRDHFERLARELINLTKIAENLDEQLGEVLSLDVKPSDALSKLQDVDMLRQSLGDISVLAAHFAERCPDGLYLDVPPVSSVQLQELYARLCLPQVDDAKDASSGEVTLF